jgi:hypothetical protein
MCHRRLEVRDRPGRVRIVDVFWKLEAAIAMSEYPEKFKIDLIIRGRRSQTAQIGRSDRRDDEKVIVRVTFLACDALIEIFDETMRCSRLTCDRTIPRLFPAAGRAMGFSNLTFVCLFLPMFYVWGGRIAIFLILVSVTVSFVLGVIAAAENPSASR